jgi:MarR family transcriptional regulator, lower aerobic nicotinate degradation pathway regulator
MAVQRSTPTDHARAILDRLRRLVRALRMTDRQAQNRWGLGAAQMFILHALAHDGDGISLNELAERTATDQSSASLAVGKLVDEGHVRRTMSTADRRQVRLSLTPKGRALAKRIPPPAQERILESVGGMSAREREQLMALLDKLLGGKAT